MESISEANLTDFDNWLDHLTDKVTNAIAQGLVGCNQTKDVLTSTSFMSGAECAGYSYGAMTFLIVVGAFLIIFGILLFCGVIGSLLDPQSGGIIRDHIHRVYLTSQGTRTTVIGANGIGSTNADGAATDALSSRDKNTDLSWPALYWIISGAVLIIAGKSGQELIGLITC